jgi:hypothetical protein
MQTMTSILPGVRRAALAAVAAGLALGAGPGAEAHGVAGNRFFPATIATDDPAVADELSLPTVTWTRSDDAPPIGQTDIAGEYSKRLTSRLGVSVATGWSRLVQPGAPTAQGFQNLETTLKYQALTDDAHEAIVSAGVSVEWGGSGAARVGAEPVTTVTPTLWFGKGAGDLPQNLAWARPFAVTGVVGYAVPTRSGETSSLEYGLTLQYSLRYLTAHVRDVGLPRMLSQMTPLVEVALSTPVSNRSGAATTGTVNPGVLWSGRRLQIGLEAVIPVNRASGRGVGAAIQAHWFLDDLFPRSIGKPIL